ncbi:MAG: hypothetical protein A2504_04165 [Bdellovibrionales bacterium RIFOXYD12_FULL_39_22]|nr:MAG: hypothetical protein A2385_07660 [Bdellovibrionales bacterium RIFOXYB1_FULL_39_21]OFZ42133.1 MAG: hypothetical protein A2485_09625 [Bdellovibrionales bacterium RIFOXYC12_FULL_39_17]OFZ50849.1 MAG: hypothetical protein A2404_06575 [Bdellovibrionales bacterium RIFOXYC1_FULL_39_130]OFZ73315.1 MAG: hypothetical protein A2451_10315 [Bdellovibrionales bacterium RIFOXYC2_FULL_39_8]OFZ78072.1 MAG: hypothetical protein A2560_01745 [Bdellovibrionales bacterium RIFOXYD1_FULL_39_84]OFZ93491.1 MAG:
MKKIIIALLLLQFISISAMAKAREKDPLVEDQTEFKPKTEERRVYTEDEFMKAVYEEVEKKLKILKKDNAVDLSMELLRKEDDIKRKDLAIQKQKEELAINIKAFEGKILEFQEQQSKLIGCLTDVEKQEDKRINHMVEVISGMKPASAAEVLSVQDAEIAVKILDKLEATKVSKIFNLMDKEVSARLQKQYLTMKR